MNSPKKHTVIYIVATVAIIAMVYYIIKSAKGNTPGAMTNQNLVNAIIANKASLTSSDDYTHMLTYDNGYLQAWYNGLSANKSTFLYNGKNYYTAGGTAA